MEKKQVTNEELYEYLYSIEPIDDTQANLINKIMGIIYKSMYKSYDQTVIEFIDYYDSFEGKECTRVYKVYLEFCEERNYKPLNNKAFGRQLRNKCRLGGKTQRVNGVPSKVYIFKEVY